MATALTAALGDGKQFRNGRQFSASLVPRQDGTEVQLSRISKRGDPAQQPRHPINWRLRKGGPGSPHLKALVETVNQVAVAIANRNARVAWAMVRRIVPAEGHRVFSYAGTGRLSAPGRDTR